MMNKVMRMLVVTLEATQRMPTISEKRPVVIWMIERMAKACLGEVSVSGWGMRKRGEDVLTEARRKIEGTRAFHLCPRKMAQHRQSCSKRSIHDMKLVSSPRTIRQSPMTM
jgi:hypothetical protein